MKKDIFEWVVLCKDREFYLTENQHKALIENQDKRFVTFKDFTIQPSMVSYSYRRIAQEIKEMYPCLVCNTNGYLIGQSGEIEGSWKTCDNCEGTGVDTK